MNSTMIVLLIAGFGVIAYFMYKRAAVESQKTNLRMRGMASVSRTIRPNESMRVENMTLRDKDGKKYRVPTLKVDNHQFDESELTPDIQGRGYEDELPFIDMTVEDKSGNKKRVRNQRLRSEPKNGVYSENYVNHDVRYWQQAKILDEQTNSDLVSLVDAKKAITAPRAIELIDLLVGQFKQCKFSNGYKQVGEDAIAFAVDQQAKPILVILTKTGEVKRAVSTAWNTVWETADIEELIDQLKAPVNP